MFFMPFIFYCIILSAKDGVQWTILRRIVEGKKTLASLISWAANTYEMHMWPIHLHSGLLLLFPHDLINRMFGSGIVVVH